MWSLGQQGVGLVMNSAMYVSSRVQLCPVTAAGHERQRLYTDNTYGFSSRSLSSSLVGRAKVTFTNQQRLPRQETLIAWRRG